MKRVQLLIAVLAVIIAGSVAAVVALAQGSQARSPVPHKAKTETSAPTANGHASTGTGSMPAGPAVTLPTANP
jgi:hypothetical protein